MWFLIAVMATVYDGGKKDIYIWHSPEFSSAKECLTYVELNPDKISGHLYRTFPDDKMEKLFCIPEDKLKRFLDDVKNEGKVEL